MCSIKCKENEERHLILEILKDFKCLDKIREEIQDKYKKQQHLKQITNAASENKEFIYYGGFPKYETTNESRQDTLNGNYEYELEKKNSHYNYWLKIKKKDEELPKKLLHCLCFQCIINPCLIKNIRTNKLYVVGSECINKFVPQDMRGRRCEHCNNKHSNSKDNFCKNCRIIIKEEKKLKEIEERKLERIRQNKIIEEQILEREKKNQIERELRLKKLKEIEIEEKKIKKENENIYNEHLYNEFKKDGICKFGTKHRGKKYIDIFKYYNSYIESLQKIYMKQKKELGYIKKDNIYFFLKLHKEYKNKLL